MYIYSSVHEFSIVYFTFAWPVSSGLHGRPLGAFSFKYSLMKKDMYNVGILCR